MKKILGCILLTLVTTSLCCAEVFVYKNRIKSTVTSGGTATRENLGGWTLINDSGQVIQVLAYTRQKRFAIVPMRSIDVGSGAGARGRDHTFFVQQDIWTDEQGNTHLDTGGAKGVNTPLDINGVSWNIPKSYSWSGRSMVRSANPGEDGFGETSGSFVLDRKETARLNSEGADLQYAAEQLAGVLEQKGFVQF